jgi:hypothetical protein
MERVSTNIRLPGDLYEEIKAIALREDRSLNAQMVRFLRDAVDREKTDAEAAAKADRLARAFASQAKR